MLAGLSPWGILSMPPDFCATADAEIKMSASAAHTAARPHAIAFPMNLIIGSPGALASRYSSSYSKIMTAVDSLGSWPTLAGL
jgi:hypothetical protein